MSEILVSISCITYNHSKYIEKCLEGFLMQKTNFKIEVLIHDDASTDGTQEIIKTYQEEHPDIIKPIFQKENQYSKGKKGFNAKYNYSRAQGKYIALCEGDDYWTDPLKLQKQVDFLDANTGYILCFTNCSTIDKNGTLRNPKFLKYNEDKSFSEKDLMFVAPTLTRVFRLNLLKNINKNINYYEAPGDAIMLINLLREGKAKYLNFISGNYRKHNEGVWTSLDRVSIRKSKFEIAYYGFRTSNKNIKLLFLKKVLLELSKLNVEDRYNYRLKHDKFIYHYKNYISLSFYQLIILKLYFAVDYAQVISSKNVFRIQLRLIRFL